MSVVCWHGTCIYKCMIDSVSKRQQENLLLSVNPIAEYLKDDAYTDLYINPDGKLFIKAFAKPRQYTGIIVEPAKINRIIEWTAHITGKVVNEAYPMLSAIMPYFDMRIQGTIPPWVSAPTICIRKKYKTVIPLQRFVDDNRITENQFEFLINAIKTQKNIILGGGTGSGKTTLLNSLIDSIGKINPTHSLLIIEDTGEVMCSAPDYKIFIAEPEKTIEITRAALRFYPNRILFGELRYGDVALELMKIWISGHPGGLATIHLDSARLVLTRVQQLIQECNYHMSEEVLAQTINVCVYLKDSGNGPKAEEIVEIKWDKDTNKVLYTNIY